MVLSNGSSFFVHPRVVRRHGLFPGLGITLDLPEQLVLESEHSMVYDKGLELLARREHSRRELHTKLVSRGFAGEAVQAVLDELERSGALDELRFACRWIESRLRRKPEARMMLDAGLARKGLDRETREIAINRVYRDSPDLFDHALERAAAAFLKTDRDPDKLAARLNRRGFGWTEIRHFMQSIE